MPDAKSLTTDIVAILSDLIAIPSAYPPGDTREICAYAAKRLAAAGYEVAVESRADGIDNVVARLGSGRPSVVFNAHADTVGVDDRSSWLSDPLAADVRDGAVFGLGAGNCKGSMAVQLWLAEEIARRGGPAKGEVVFTFVGDEERLGPDGLLFLKETGRVDPDMLILGAQTQLQAIGGERGVMWVGLTAHGKSVHAGDPDAGDNAILRMMRLLQTLERELRPRLDERRRGLLRPTMSVGLINGGLNTNAVPSQCTAEIDFRLMPTTAIDDAVAEIETCLKAADEPEGSYDVRLLTGTKGFASPAGAPCVTAFHAAIETVTGEAPRDIVAIGASDGRYFADDPIEILTFGPGSAAHGHSANESVPVADLAPAALIQLDVIERLLGLGG